MKYVVQRKMEMLVNKIDLILPSVPKGKIVAIDGLEQTFLTEVLKTTGPKALAGSFGGGIGEEPFVGILNSLSAKAMAEQMDLRMFSTKEI